MNQQKSLDQWRTILADYDRSNQTQAAFCRRRGIAPSSFHYHRKRQRGDGDPAQRLIEIRPASSELSAPSCIATTVAAESTTASAAVVPELRIEVPLSSTWAVTLHCTLAQLPEVISKLTSSSHHSDR